MKQLLPGIALLQALHIVAKSSLACFRDNLFRVERFQSGIAGSRMAVPPIGPQLNKNAWPQMTRPGMATKCSGRGNFKELIV